jgi:hypothetical protein
MSELSLTPPSNRFDATVDRRSRDDARDEREADRFEERLEEARQADDTREEERRAQAHAEDDGKNGAANTPLAPKGHGGKVSQTALGSNPAVAPGPSTGSWTQAFSQIAPIAGMQGANGQASTQAAAPAAEIKTTTMAPKGSEVVSQAKLDATTQAARTRGVEKPQATFEPEWVETPDSPTLKAKALAQGEGLRVFLDRDLAIEVAWQPEGLEVRVDGSHEAVDPLKDLGSAMEDMLGRQGARLLDYSTHVRTTREQVALKSENETTDEQNKAVARRVLKGTLVNVVV